ncbi:hypothetical protein FPZ41_09400 [Streptomyces sp. K1PN6]|uniref:Integrase SAM-like N-terminal domain-containing protein n=1 Tax=Streptomyces acidicola TaxID=2596892 RepID=A0A5N8WNR5_9ACTN|nr:hypothetical protein [Streptomyces acidicola]
MAFLLDRWLGVAELDETSYERAEGIIRNYIKPTFGDLKAGKLTAEMLELFYARLRQRQDQIRTRALIRVWRTTRSTTSPAPRSACFAASASRSPIEASPPPCRRSASSSA